MIPLYRTLRTLHHALPAIVFAAALSAHAQDASHVNYFHTHGASLSVGATGQFSNILEQNPTSGAYNVTGPGGALVPINVSNKQQYTTDSTGFLTSLAYHPAPWAGVELNYGFTHYSERYGYNYSGIPATQRTSVPTDWHEATAAYQFHPKHIPFQPFVNIGGGAIDFAPSSASNQWRGAGLLEAGFDLPVHYSHIGFRVEGRSLYYRSPNFYQPVIGTRSWRVTTQPSISAFYRF